ncbi:hypothetical protein CDD81_5215 [Ophiocordyceps australis]|uniref:Uncharacterized protein n=1 Tax=Ophiocordyceps australis TaxID=1399860 RepID=A0A2C5YGX7_9HYPO|nr:hypothetical protein CDD81_5215 [Ophiocordyceps australis]
MSLKNKGTPKTTGPELHSNPSQKNNAHPDRGGVVRPPPGYKQTAQTHSTVPEYATVDFSKEKGATTGSIKESNQPTVPEYATVDFSKKKGLNTGTLKASNQPSMPEYAAVDLSKKKGAITGSFKESSKPTVPEYATIDWSKKKGAITGSIKESNKPTVPEYATIDWSKKKGAAGAGKPLDAVVDKSGGKAVTQAGYKQPSQILHDSSDNSLNRGGPPGSLASNQPLNTAAGHKQPNQPTEPLRATSYMNSKQGVAPPGYKPPTQVPNWTGDKGQKGGSSRESSAPNRDPGIAKASEGAQPPDTSAGKSDLTYADINWEKLASNYPPPRPSKSGERVDYAAIQKTPN